MLLRQLFEQQTSTYTYVLGDTASGKAVIIDPVAEKTDDYMQLLSELALTLDYSLDTHTHADHITGMGRLRELSGCQALIGKQSKAECVSGNFAEGSEIAFGAYCIEVLYTPGHTDDSYSFLLKSPEPMVFTGDTLLIRGTGRTDFQNGDARLQYQSCKRLLQLPDNTLVYPGHDYKGWTVSTIAEEKQFNPRLQAASEDAYVALMAGLHLPVPKLMDIAVAANQECGNMPDLPT